MIKIKPFQLNHIQDILSQVQRNQLQFQEYQFLEISQLLNKFQSDLKEVLSNIDAHAFVAIEETHVLGFINCELNGFDSEHFAFNCYNIKDLIIFSESNVKINNLSKILITTLEKKLATISSSYHITVNLSNNLLHQNKIFNSLIRNSFYYIHTLISFRSYKKKYEVKSYYPKEELLIRTANKNDVKQVSAIAEKSYKYSRFHMDPFLDDSQANKLLKQSAENSILENYVDIMFIAEINSQIVGYYSGKKRYIPEFEQTLGTVVFSSVDSNHRGIGIFSIMDSHILNWFSDNTDFSEMGTYLINYPVHKTWVNKGLNIFKASHQFSKFV